jgi:hypothetical protein
MTAAPPKVCPTSRDLTAGPLHEADRLSGVVYLVGKRAVTPVALGVAKSEVVEAEHADALAGQLLADAARRGRILSEGEPVGKDAPSPDGSLRMVDEACEPWSARTHEPHAFGHRDIVADPVRTLAIL